MLCGSGNKCDCVARGQHHQHVVSAPLMMIPCNFSQLEESEAKCAEAQRSQQTAALELENLHTELETLSRSKTLVGAWRCGQGRAGGRAQPHPGGFGCSFAESATTRGFKISPQSVNYIQVYLLSLQGYSLNHPGLFGNNNPRVV